MLTPLFRLAQDDEYLYVIITARSIKLRDAEVYHEGREFIFYAKPYYLRLDLPGEVLPSEDAPEQSSEEGKEQVENQKKKPSYDFDTHELNLPVPKKTIGEVFDDLDMISKFLSKPKSKPTGRLVEVISSEGGDQQAEEEEEDDFDWNIEQEVPSEVSLQIGSEPYGFANNQTGVIERLGEDFKDLVDVRQPSSKLVVERRKERLQHERDHFDEDHYLADLYEQKDHIESLIEAKAPWVEWSNEILTDADRQRLIDHIPKRDFLKYDSRTKKALLLGLVDLVYAYAYDLRSNEFEHTVESAWTITKLSPTLSWFETWIPVEGIDDDLPLSHDLPCYVLASCIRRALVYPLYRNWALALKVAQDVVTIVRKGRNAVLKCLLDMHRLVNEAGDNYYVLNDLYITDYCAWLSCTKPTLFHSLADHLETRWRSRITRSEVALDLELLEQAARMALDEQCLASGIQQVTLHHQQPEQLDSDDDDDEM